MVALLHKLLFKCFNICSSIEHFHSEVEQLKSIFKCNKYSINIIDHCIEKLLDKMHVPEQSVTAVPK